jgi:hypothetical protein
MVSSWPRSSATARVAKPDATNSPQPAMTSATIRDSWACTASRACCNAAHKRRAAVGSSCQCSMLVSLLGPLAAPWGGG